MRKQDQIKKAYESYIHKLDYIYCHYKKFNYDILHHIYYFYKIGNRDKITINDVIIMCDTETSKKQPDEEIVDSRGFIKYKTHENHVVAWTISIRAFHKNICTLYGRKPSTLAQTMLRIHEHMQGMQTIFYFHNLSYDHWFMRRFWIDLYNKPIHQLNTKPHYPIYIEYENGIIIKDSLILAQRKLEKWASDLGVEHQKEVGKWDYDKIRNQTGYKFSQDELDYIEHDTLAGVECIDATIEALNKHIYSIPYTATGIPREQTRKRGGKKAHEDFLKMSLTLEQYIKMNHCYHGGFTHGNRHFVNTLINWKQTKAYDFVSSYPFALLAFKYPMEKFTPLKRDVDADFINRNREEYSFMFKFVAINIRLKSDAQPMPALQFSKCMKTINAILDNGRILASNYVSIYLTEWDIAVISEQYTWDKHICTEVEFARKDYLPRWFTDYIYECFTDKTMLKNKDKILYSIAKSRVNSLYGMTVQKPLRDDIIEDYETGEYKVREIENPHEEYQKYVDKISSILPYQWGVACTAIAFYNLHQLLKCCTPLYCDTDSCYGLDWNEEMVSSYNKGCKEKLLANGYGAVIANDREYWLGVAEHDPNEDIYIEFKYMGAKRYCGRCKGDNQIHLTVAGVPKKLGALCLDNDINNFHTGFIFSGLKTGKKTHVYFSNEIYIDENGNETGDSISLIPCDYELDSIEIYNWEELFNEEIQIQIYDDI